MQRIKWFVGAVIGVMLMGGAVAQNSGRFVGPSTYVRGYDKVFTNIWQGTRVIDLSQYDSAVLRITINSGNAAETIQFKTQWTDSTNKSSFVDESVLAVGAASAGVQVFTNLTRVISMTCTNSTYIERFNRLARFFRVACKSDTASPSTPNSGADIVVTPLNN